MTDLLTTTDTRPGSAGYTLNVFERAALVDLGQELMSIDFVSEPDRYALTSQLLAGSLSIELRRAVIDFKRAGSPTGGFELRGLPLDPSLPPTPTEPARAAVASPLSAAMLSIVAAALGDQFGFEPELDGFIIQGIVPVPGAEHTQRSVSSLDPLKMHVETAFTEFRADFVLLHCLRQDHDSVAGTCLSAVDDILARLDPTTQAVLRTQRFATRVDESFMDGEADLFIGPIRVLHGPRDRATFQVDFNETVGLDATAQRALDELRVAATAAATTVHLETGTILIIDNRSLHGRTPFTPRWDGLDRWLLRTFVTRDFPRSNAHRPNDGRTIDEDLQTLVLNADLRAELDASGNSPG